MGISDENICDKKKKVGRKGGTDELRMESLYNLSKS